MYMYEKETVIRNHMLFRPKLQRNQVTAAPGLVCFDQRQWPKLA